VSNSCTKKPKKKVNHGAMSQVKLENFGIGKPSNQVEIDWPWIVGTPLDDAAACREVHVEAQFLTVLSEGRVLAESPMEMSCSLSREVTTSPLAIDPKANVMATVHVRGDETMEAATGKGDANGIPVNVVAGTRRKHCHLGRQLFVFLEELVVIDELDLGGKLENGKEKLVWESHEPLVSGRASGPFPVWLDEDELVGVGTTEVTLVFGRPAEEISSLFSGFGFVDLSGAHVRVHGEFA